MLATARSTPRLSAASLGSPNARCASHALRSCFAVGGVPPLGHVHPLPILVDGSLSRFETVYAAAGSANSLFPIRYTTLIEVTGGEVYDLTE